MNKLAFLTAVMAMPSLAAAAVLPGPVVDAAWLKAHQDQVVILDVRDEAESWTTAPEYEKDEKTGEQKLVAAGGHIDTALAVDFGKLRVSRMVDGKKIDKMLPDRAQVQTLMQAIGLNAGKPIVITSPGEAADQIDAAARLYWTLKVYGATEMALLDGGNAAWIAAGFPVSVAKSEAKSGDWQAAELDRSALAELADIEKALAKHKIQFVDARPLPQFLGLSFKKPSVAAGGHLAGAHNFPTDVRTRTRGIAEVFLSADEYRAVLKAQRIDARAPTITYCNTGHMAAGAWFVQSEILGADKVRLYDGSMHEWTTLGRPVRGLQ